MLPEAHDKMQINPYPPKIAHSGFSKTRWILVGLWGNMHFSLSVGLVWCWAHIQIWHHKDLVTRAKDHMLGFTTQLPSQTTKIWLTCEGQFLRSIQWCESFPHSSKLVCSVESLAYILSNLECVMNRFAPILSRYAMIRCIPILSNWD